MSKVGHHDFRCPRCGHRQRFTIWESVTAHLDPELKSRILNGTFFRQRCGGCNSPIELTHPVLYHDTNLRLAVWLAEGGVNGEFEAAMDSFGMSVPSYYRLRIVYNLRELAETIAIFDAGLSDWFVLMLKVTTSGQNGLSASDFVFTGVDRSGKLLFEVDMPQGKRQANISGGENQKLICSQWNELEEDFDWIYTSEDNFYKVYSAFADRFS